MSHWAASLIGKPYQRGGVGPEAFDCWGLVRHVFMVRWGISLPLVAVADAEVDNGSAIRQVATACGWWPVDDPRPQDGDIALLHGLEGRHVGVIVAADGGLKLLHAFEGAGACAQSLGEAALAGFTQPEFWRRT